MLPSYIFHLPLPRDTSMCSERNRQTAIYWRTSSITSFYTKLVHKYKHISQPSNPHQSIAHSDNNQQGDDTRRDTPTNKVFYLQVSLTSLRIFHHDCRYQGQCMRLILKDRVEWEGDILILGKPEVGSPIAALHIKALPITNNLG